MELSFNNIHYTYPGLNLPALHGVDLAISSGECVALVGPNGSGKTTLMLTANGILHSQKGEVRVNGQPVSYTRKGLVELRRKVGIIFQNPEDQLFSASVYQDISLGPLNLGFSQTEARLKVLEAAELCGLTTLLERPTHSLSGGEKTRTALAGVLAMSPKFLFADELTNSLDPWMRRQILEILEKLARSGCAVILATHDWNLARRWAQRVIWLDNGRVFRQGTPEEVITEIEYSCSDKIGIV